MATLAIIAIAGAAATTAYGEYQAGKAAEAEGKAQQQIAEYNAKLKEREAAAERERARVEAEQFKERGRGLLAEQRVGYAKGGVLTTGTPAEVIDITSKNLEADRMRILKEGFLAGSFRESEAEGLRYEGRAARARGKAAKRGAMFSAAGSILSGIGQSAYTYKSLT